VNDVGAPAAPEDFLISPKREKTFEWDEDQCSHNQTVNDVRLHSRSPPGKVLDEPAPAKVSKGRSSPEYADYADGSWD
jgi:hypothetical protein